MSVCSLIAVSPPLLAHSSKATSEGPATQEKLVDFIRSVAHAGVTLHAFSTPADYGGSADDFYDGVHMGRFNGDRLVDFVLKPGEPG